MVEPITDTMINQFLVEIEKRRVEQLLDLASNRGLSDHNFWVIGTSAAQRETVRRWLALVVLPQIVAGPSTELAVAR